MKFFLLFFFLANSAKAIPVISNFVSGQSNVTTESSQTVREIQKIYSYSNTASYAVTGVNIAPENESRIISPSYTTVGQNTINDVTSTWTGVDLSNKPTFIQVNPGDSTQFMETISQPGLTSVLELDRTTTTTSISTSISTFSQ
tara:strand:+ start:246 stop:677 length:432 start_codon:yes stop_codon:yes gene_type:complete